MKVIQSTAIAFLYCFSNIQADRNTLRCVDPDTVDNEKDYFPDKVQPEYSEHWDISYHNTYKILPTSWQEHPMLYINVVLNFQLV
jgi:hypothetical protein